MVRIGNKEFIDCTECTKYKLRKELHHGVCWGIYGSIVYLEP